MTLIRVKSTGQVIDMVPRTAMAMVDGGTAELVEDRQTETTTAEPRAEKAIGRGQNPPKRKRA